MDRYPAFTFVIQIITVVLVTIPTSCAMPHAASVAPTKSQHSTFIDLVERAGYIAEEYEVVTEDGYIQYLHRIPGGPNSPVAPRKSPVVLVHGFLGSSDSWVLQGAEYDFAYLLVDSGYDVWLPNARGNYYGRRHKRMSIDDPQFWQFSWHEIGIYDIAASINCVLSRTGMLKLSVVAYSLGSSAMYALLSIRPEYNEKVHVSVMFGSIAIFTHHVPGILLNIGVHFGKELESFLRFIGKFDLFSRGNSSFSITDVCRYPMMNDLCLKLALHCFGITHSNGYGKLIKPEAMSHHSQGTSVQSSMHLRQIVLSRKFTQYDYGRTKNYGRYESFNPPEYQLEKITSPMVLYYAPGDLYTTKEDVEALVKKIPRAISSEIPDANFGHRDFITSRTAKELLYNSVLRVLEKHRRVKLD